MTLTNTQKPKPTGVFMQWFPIKRCSDTQKIILLNSGDPRAFDVVNPTNFEYPDEGGAVRLVRFERKDTPDGQIVRLLRIQSYKDDTTVFSAISVHEAS